MKHFSLVVFFLHFCLFNLSLALFSSKQLEIFTVFFKPYGINLKDDCHDSILMKVTRNLGQCSAFNETFKYCNSIIVKLTSSTTENELSKLTSRCPSGSYVCFYNAVKSDSLLKGWLKKVQNTTKDLCSKKCWQTLEQLVNSCIQPGKSEIKKSDRSDALFISELLKSLCIQEGKSSCADKFINGLLVQSSNSNSQACRVKTNLLGNNCSSNCHQDLLQFYNKLGCCVGSVSSIMESYSIKPQNESYGIFVKERYSICHLKKIPPACSQDTKLQASPSPTRSVISSKGNLIAGVCIAVLTCIGGAIIVGSFVYQRMKRRANIRFEDYGYSRLKMLENEFYFDVETDDDDSKGLVQL